MGKLSKKEREKITLEYKVNRRGDTFCGFRPVIMDEKSTKYDRKCRRLEGRKLCREYC